MRLCRAARKASYGAQGINAGLANPKIAEKIAAIGGVVLPGSSAEFTKFIADETEKWTKVVKFSGARAE